MPALHRKLFKGSIHIHTCPNSHNFHFIEKALNLVLLNCFIVFIIYTSHFMDRHGCILQLDWSTETDNCKTGALVMSKH